VSKSGAASALVEDETGDGRRHMWPAQAIWYCICKEKLEHKKLTGKN